MVIGFLSVQSSFVFQSPDADVFNSYIHRDVNEYGNYMISVTDDVGFFEKNDRHYYRESEPMMFHSGMATSNNVQYTLLETWPLQFENDNPRKDNIYQLIYTWYGTVKEFDDDFQIGLSTSLFAKLYPGHDSREFASFTLPLRYNDKTITAKIAFLYDANIAGTSSSRGKLYHSVFGLNCMFVNTNIIHEFGFNDLTIVYNQNNYAKLFNHKLFQSFSSNQISTYDYFKVTNDTILENLMICQNYHAVRVMCLVFDAILIFVYAYYAIKKHQKVVNYYIFGLAYTGTVAFLAFLEKVIGGALLVSASGFWFVFLVGVLMMLLLLITDKRYEKEQEWKEGHEICI